MEAENIKSLAEKRGFKSCVDLPSDFSRLQKQKNHLKKTENERERERE